MRAGLSRRTLVVSALAVPAGLLVGLGPPRRAGAAASTAFVNPYLRIDDDGITLILPNNEMGQGVMTAQAMILADELDANWERVRTAFAPPGEAYFIPGTRSQETGGSQSIGAWFEPLRRVGAATREMLVAAAVARWDAAPADCRTEASEVIHRDGRRLGYTALAADAARQPVPGAPRLKAPTEFKLIGRPVPRRDTLDKITGRARFTIDEVRPGQLCAAIRQAPRFGATVARVDDRAARAAPGVHSVLRVEPGAAVAVVAETYWQAERALEKVEIVYDAAPDAPLGAGDVARRLRAQLDVPGARAAARGDPASALAPPAAVHEAVYELPYLAHVPLEPPSCVAEVSDGACTLWVGNQEPSAFRAAAARASGLPPEKVAVNSLLIGGSFGRRLETDFAEQAVQIAKAVGRPIKLIWSRQEDIRHDFYRPAAAVRLRASVAGGRLSALEARIASPSILSRVDPTAIRDGVDGWAVKGLADLAYDIDHLRVDYADVAAAVPVGWWRAVDNSQNAFIAEGFIDELAHAAGADPYRFRRDHLGGDPRLQAVLDLAATRAGWARPRRAGRALGLAVTRCFGSRVAHVAEVGLDEGQIVIHHVHCAIDCGQVVNPDTVAAQIEGGIAYGLSAALSGQVTLRDGAVVEANFDDHPVLTLARMPKVSVHIMPSEAPPAGVGEPGLPGIAPAVVNALFALTGRRVRRLPLEPWSEGAPA